MSKTKKITIWALSAIAMVSVFLGVFFFTLKAKKTTLTPSNVAEVKDTVTDENGNNLMGGEYHSLPARMLFTPAPLAATLKTFSVNLAVTVTPMTAATKPLDWAVDFVNADSEWTSGKTVTDYVTVTPTVDGAKTATVTCLKAFGEQIKISVTARENPDATASCLLDYKQRLLSYDLSVAQAGKSPTVNVSRKSGKLVADVESDNEITFGYSYSKSDVYTVALNDSEIAKPTAMTLSYKSALSSAMNKVKENAAIAPIATATENGFKVTGYLNKNAVDGLSIENHNKIIAAINSNYYSSTTITLNDADGNTLVKYTFDTDTSLVKKQGKVESIAMDRPNFEFGDKDKTYTITYLCGKSTSKLGLFEVGSEHGNSRLADGSYPTSYKYGEKVTISTLKRDYGCGGIYHSGSGSPSATYRFSGWFLDWNLTQPFTGEFPAGTVGGYCVVCGYHLYGITFLLMPNREKAGLFRGDKPTNHIKGINDMKDIKRNEIYYADLNPVIGSEQGGIRPVLVIQNDTGNKYSPTTIVAAITSRQNKSKLPTHIEIGEEVFEKDSIVLLEQIRTLDKRRLKEYVGKLDNRTMDRVNKAISISVALDKAGENKDDGRTG